MAKTTAAEETPPFNLLDHVQMGALLKTYLGVEIYSCIYHVLDIRHEAVIFSLDRLHLAHDVNAAMNYIKRKKG